MGEADTLYEDGTLYISLRDNRSITGNSRLSLLYRVDYLGDGQWDTPEGPTTITTQDPETLTIARDSRGRLWAAYESSRRIRVGSTVSQGTIFSFTDLATPAVASDDIATVVAFGANTTTGRIGVLWSDQVSGRIRFAWRLDSDSIGSSAWHYETAYSEGPSDRRRPGRSNPS